MLLNYIEVTTHNLGLIADRQTEKLNMIDVTKSDNETSY